MTISKERSPQTGFRPEFYRLTGVFNNERSPSRKKQLITEMLDSAIHEVPEMTPLVGLAKYGLDGIESERAADHVWGRIALNGIEDYIKIVGVLQRPLAPSGAMEQPGVYESLHQGVVDLNERVEERIRKNGMNEYPGIASLARRTSAAFGTGSKEGIAVAVAASPEITNHPRFRPMWELRKQIFRDSADKILYTPEEEKLYFKEEIIGNVIEASEYKVPGVPDMLTHRWNEISFQELLADISAEDFKEKAKKFISGIPPGDMIWQQFVGALFGTTFFGTSHNPVDDLTYRIFHENVFAFQRELAENLFLPAVRPELRDAKADRDIGALVTSLDTVILKRLTLALITVAQNAMIHDGIYRSAELSTHKEDFPLTDLAVSAKQGEIDETDSFFVDLATLSFLKDNLGKIDQSLKRRFRNTPKMFVILERLHEYLPLEDVASMHDNGFWSIIFEHIASADLDKLLTTQNAKSSFSFQNSPSYKTDEGGVLMEFDETTTPRALGLKNIQFTQDPRSSDRLVCVISVEGKKQMNIIGKTDRAGNVTAFSLKKMGEETQFGSYLRSLISASFYELFGGKLVVPVIEVEQNPELHALPEGVEIGPEVIFPQKIVRSVPANSSETMLANPETTRITQEEANEMLLRLQERLQMEEEDE